MGLFCAEILNFDEKEMDDVDSAPIKSVHCTGQCMADCKLCICVCNHEQCDTQCQYQNCENNILHATPLVWTNQTDIPCTISTEPLSTSGPPFNLRDKSASEIVNLLLDPFLDHLVQNSATYAQEKHLDKSCISKRDFVLFLSVLLQMGLTPHSAVKLYWQIDSLNYGNKYIQQQLTQQKF